MKRHHLFLILIFVVVLAFNTIYTFQSSEFTTDNAYNTLRQVEHIVETGVPLYSDDLSFSGRNHMNAPLYYYILAFFSFIFPLHFVAKIIPIIFSSSMVFIIYLIAKKISNNRNVALLSAFISGFIPVYTSLTLNTISVYSFIIPIMFLSLYFFIKIEEDEKYITYFIISFLVALLTSPITLFLIFILLTYLAIVKIEGHDISSIEKEIILFSTFFIVWAYFIMYKNVLLEFGPNVVWQTLPLSIRAEYFSSFSILTGILNIGLLPFLLGTYTLYTLFFKQKNKGHYLYISMALLSFTLLLLNFIEIKIGLSLLAFTLVVLFSHYYKNFLLYIKKTKFSSQMGKIVLIFVIVFIVTSVLPTINAANRNISDAFHNDEIKAMGWIKNNTEKDAVIVSSPHEGAFISYKTGRKNVIDTDFLLIKDASERLSDIRTIYRTRYGTEAIPLLTKYDADYILLTDRILLYYDINSIKYIDNEKCFDLVYNDRARIYKTKCRIETQRGTD